MRRLNFLQDDPWDEVAEGAAQLGASLIEYLARAPGGPMHMHYGVEEM
jgi:hypothetical protein